MPAGRPRPVGFKVWGLGVGIRLGLELGSRVVNLSNG